MRRLCRLLRDDAQRDSVVICTVLPLTCHPERREPCAANEVELLRVERSRRRSSKQKREALVPKRDLRRITNSFPKAKLHPLSWEHPHYKNVTFLWQDKSNSLRDPCVAPLLALIAFAPLISIGFDYGFHPPLRMTHRGYVVRTYEKNAVCDGYTSSYSLRLFPSPQGEGLLNSAL